MNTHDPIIVVSGLVHEAHINKLRAERNTSEPKILLACATPSTREHQHGVSCIDLTGHAHIDKCVHACLHQSVPGDIVIVRDHQLDHRALVEAIASSNLRGIVLNTDASYDTDPGWITSRLRWAASLIPVEWFALDLFCDVEESWETLRHARDDEFNLSDLQQICNQFPVILSADTKPENLMEIATFPGARGVLLPCDELMPVIPQERHTLPFDAVVHLLNLFQKQC
ncbi:hypothetical protein [Sorangium sp. So ce426]|uniref:hypothetical protein n=1 Tax=Sorangium sp. So ce426 TaxID=3133312 RepID=UPI003F5B1B9B